MTSQINRVPAKRIEPETPIDVTSDTPEAADHKRMERAADRLAHKGTDAEKHFDQDHDKFSNIGTN